MSTALEVFVHAAGFAVKLNCYRFCFSCIWWCNCDVCIVKLICGASLPSVLWHCWLGHLTRKTCPRYNL